MHDQTATAQQIEQKTANEQQTLYFTLSLYADQKRVRGAFARPLDDFLKSGRELRIHQKYRASLELRDGIEPLFNDITDRERESEIEDFLLSTANGLSVEKLTITVPSELRWTTEGIQFTADLGDAVSRDIDMRAFWYVHANGAISYHMSFICRYEHTANDFYFLSMLQKACAPKEFKSADHNTAGRDIDFLDDKSGVFPLESVTVASDRLSSGASATFWTYVRQCFNDHARDLFEHEAVAVLRKDLAKDYFTTLIDRDGFIEVPGLKMPRARCLFLFHDEMLFKLLRREERKKIANKGKSIGGFHEISRDIRSRIESAKSNRKLDRSAAHVLLDRSFLDKVEKHENALRYYFVSGFCQNIIDFLNQDASEIRDSLDPIYPANEDQEAENFFFRFANPRSMVQVVERSRSLNIGNDYIGTCPYAFLVHVASLHNEFLTRTFESDVAILRQDVDDFVASKSYKSAANLFYLFRKTTLSDHARYRYENVFRYDSESDCFAGLEKVRGIFRKETYLKDVVSNLESMTRDLEERQKEEQADSLRRKSRYLNWLVAGIGTFSILQVLFQILDLMHGQKIALEERSWLNVAVVPMIPSEIRSHSWAGDALLQTTFFLSSAVLAGFFLFLAWSALNFFIDAPRLFRNLFLKRPREPEDK